MSDPRGTVRRAGAAEIDAVIEVDSLSPVGRQRSALLTHRVETGDCLVFDEDGVVKGYVTVRPRSFFGRDFIELIAVSPDYRHTGVGAALLRGAVRLALTNDVFTSTNESNTTMRNLLEREGWRFSGRLEGLDESDAEMVFFKRRG
jgi:GNAT superfamily N-acetyltransferase